MNDRPDHGREDADADGAEVGAQAPGETPSKLRQVKRTVLLLVAAPALLAVLGGGYLGAGYYGLIEGGPMAAAPPAVYYDLPEMVVNLSASEQRAQYLKLKVSLEAQNPTVLRTLEPLMPRVLDMFHLYLRELRTSDLEGSAAVFRLKEELLRRINLEIHPAQVDRVLFREIIVQ